MKSRGKCLVIEDDHDVRELLALILTGQGFEVYTFATAAEGIQAAQTMDLALIALDLGPPDVDGSELVHSFKNISAAPVLMITTKARDTDEDQRMAAGADAYVVKPFRPALLRKLINQLSPQQQPKATKTRGVAASIARKGMATATLAVTVTGILLAGCATPGVAPASGDASNLAASLFAPLDLSLPASADGLAVDQTPLDPFAGASLTSFTADTEEMKSICVSAGSMVAPNAEIVAQDAKVLRGAGIEPGSTLCSKDTDSGRGPAFRIVIPPTDSGKIHVAIYQLPAGR